jgi:hypothetical protein
MTIGLAALVEPPNGTASLPASLRARSAQVTSCERGRQLRRPYSPILRPATEWSFGTIEAHRGLVVGGDHRSKGWILKAREFYVDAARKLSLIWADEDDPEIKDALARLVSLYNDLANQESQSQVLQFRLDPRD